MITATDWTAVKERVATHGIWATAEEFGLTYNAIHGRARRGNWPVHVVKRRGVPRELVEHAEPNLKRRCQSCYQLTRGRCCHHCGADA